MRKYFTLLLLLMAIGIQAQPTITMNDMPAVGDTIRFRSTLLGMGIDYQQTGTNFTWDFSSLSGSTVGADTFLSVSSTNLVYQLAFNLPFDPNKANLASPQPDITFIPNLPLTNIVNFYRKATASYGFWGFGASVAGVPIPIKFNAQDILYKFPLSATSVPDSTGVSFSQGIPGLGYLSIQKKRVNIVDGWGTMITPAGSYSTLRVKSTVQETDSIYIDSLNMGFAIPHNYIEYKWLTNGKGLPVMKVSNENIIPTFTWLDSAAISSGFSVNLGQGQAVCQGTSATITANVTGGTPPFFYIWSNGSIGQTITVTPSATTTYSVTVTDAALQFATASITITVYPSPDATITKDPDWTFGCSNFPGWEITFTAPAGYSMYTWSTGASGPNLNSISVNTPANGYQGIVNYWVQVADQQGCLGSDTVAIEWIICSGISENANYEEITVYPNPTHGRIQIRFNPLRSQLLNLDIYNSLGVLVKHADLYPNGNNQTIDLRSLTTGDGLYFLRFSNATCNAVKAVILD